MLEPFFILEPDKTEYDLINPLTSLHDVIISGHSSCFQPIICFKSGDYLDKLVSISFDFSSNSDESGIGIDPFKQALIISIKTNQLLLTSISSDGLDIATFARKIIE